MEVPEDVVTCTVHGKNRGSRNLRYYPLNERVYNELGMRDTHGPFDSSLVGSVICKYPCKVSSKEGAGPIMGRTRGRPHGFTDEGVFDGPPEAFLPHGAFVLPPGLAHPVPPPRMPMPMPVPVPMPAPAPLFSATTLSHGGGRSARERAPDQARGASSARQVQEVDEENTCSMHDKLRGAKNLQVYPPTREEYSKLGLEHSHGDFKEDLVGRLVCRIPCKIGSGTSKKRQWSGTDVSPQPFEIGLPGCWCEETAQRCPIGNLERRNLRRRRPTTGRYFF
ncbi:hypothetical protein CYMTET_48756 [Cymbomonas tetramitiformis]|uniref:Uncharacterized protein n=1 Tax=Cymbomonas tetramitiformis TaxID=36881 RepID=A0AAE0BTH3_9CHLO|nr:hypothetical protein CYMTET_48756 [Cymbomonas tetramitiformis]